MSRPRVAALLSAVVASIAAFLVLKGWGLFGTLAGAALFPFVHTMASHLSNKGIDQTIAVLRKRSGDEQAAADKEQPPSPNRVDVSDRSRRHWVVPAWTRWLSVSLAGVALAIGIYSMFLDSSAERVIVRERVIEREVASAPQPTAVSDEPDAPRPETDPTTTTSTASTSSATDETAPDTDSSSTTATGPTDTTNPGETSGDIAPGDPEGGSATTVSTTVIQVGSQTTLPPTQTAP